MLQIGTHVNWIRGHDEIGGTVIERLLGELDLPNRAVITTIIVRTDDGGLEIVPETVVHEDSITPKQGAPVGRRAG